MAVWVAVSVNTFQANLQGFQPAPTMPTRINVTVSSTTGTSQPLRMPAAWSGQPWWMPEAWICNKNSALFGGLAGRPRWKQCQQS
eukprot:2843393-Amphidinium_carterae.1